MALNRFDVCLKAFYGARMEVMGNTWSNYLHRMGKKKESCILHQHYHYMNCGSEVCIRTVLPAIIMESLSITIILTVLSNDNIIMNYLIYTF